MKKPFKITPDDFHLLMQEITALTDLIEDERLLRREELDKVKIEIIALKRILAQFHPAFDSKFASVWADLIHRYDPEIEKMVD